jgi:hypothetical protein
MFLKDIGESQTHQSKLVINSLLDFNQIRKYNGNQLRNMYGFTLDHVQINYNKKIFIVAQTLLHISPLVQQFSTRTPIPQFPPFNSNGGCQL